MARRTPLSASVHSDPVRTSLAELRAATSASRGEEPYANLFLRVTEHARSDLRQPALEGHALGWWGVDEAAQRAMDDVRAARRPAAVALYVGDEVASGAELQELFAPQSLLTSWPVGDVRSAAALAALVRARVERLQTVRKP